MGKKSRPSSRQQTPAAPVPIKTAPPPVAEATEPNVADESTIETEVDALLDHAQQQVQTMTELVNEPDPQSPANTGSTDSVGGARPQVAANGKSTEVAPTAEPVAEIIGDEPGSEASGDDAAMAQPTTPAPEQPTASSDRAVDGDALQSQVDAILAQAQSDPGEATLPTSPSASDGEPDDEAVESAEAAATSPVEDLAAVDAVIADAAQRAIEEDFDSGLSVDSADGDPLAESNRSQLGTTGASPAAGEARPRGTIKGGDASMRREKPKNRQTGADRDLDGDFAPLSKGTAIPESSNGVDDPVDQTEQPASEPEFGSRAARLAFRGLALLNAPWKTWSPVTQYSILAITALNVVLAIVSYLILLQRWF